MSVGVADSAVFGGPEETHGAGSRREGWGLHHPQALPSWLPDLLRFQEKLEIQIFL